MDGVLPDRGTVRSAQALGDRPRVQRDRLGEELLGSIEQQLVHTFVLGRLEVDEWTDGVDQFLDLAQGAVGRFGGSHQLWKSTDRAAGSQPNRWRMAYGLSS